MVGRGTTHGEGVILLHRADAALVAFGAAIRRIDGLLRRTARLWCRRTAAAGIGVSSRGLRP